MTNCDISVSFLSCFFLLFFTFLLYSWENQFLAVGTKAVDSLLFYKSCSWPSSSPWTQAPSWGSCWALSLVTSSFHLMTAWGHFLLASLADALRCEPLATLPTLPISAPSCGPWPWRPCLWLLLGLSNIKKYFCLLDMNCDILTNLRQLLGGKEEISWLSHKAI